MPGRKSNLSTVTNGDEESPAPAARAPREGTSVEDLALPRTMISRLAKGVLPANTSIHKDALLALSKSATVFVNFLASGSNEYAQLSGKKTIQPGDVIAALKDNEFESFIPRLEAELKKYNTVQCDKRNSYRRKIREEKAATGDKSADAGATNGDTSMLDASEISVTNGRQRTDDQPPSKKLRREAGDDDVSEGDDDFQDGDEAAEENVEAEVEEDVDDVEDEEVDEDQAEEALEENEERVGDGLREDEALDDEAEDSD